MNKKAHTKDEEMILREDADHNISEEAMDHQMKQIMAGREMIATSVWQDGFSKRQSMFEAAYTRLRECCKEDPEYLMGEEDYKAHATAAGEAKKAHTELCAYTIDVRTICQDFNDFVEANAMFLENPLQMHFCYNNRGILAERFINAE